MPLRELFSKDSRRMFLSPLERRPPSNIQFKEAFPPHKSPTRPLLLVPVFGEEYKYSYVLFVQLPFKIGILSSPKRQNPKGQTPRVGLQLASSWSLDSQSAPSLKPPRYRGRIKQMHTPSGSELAFWVDCFFTPLLWMNVEVSVYGNRSLNI